MIEIKKWLINQLLKISNMLLMTVFHKMTVSHKRKFFLIFQITNHFDMFYMKRHVTMQLILLEESSFYSMLTYKSLQPTDREYPLSSHGLCSGCLNLTYSVDKPLSMGFDHLSRF